MFWIVKSETKTEYKLHCLQKQLQAAHDATYALVRKINPDLGGD